MFEKSPEAIKKEEKKAEKKPERRLKLPEEAVDYFGRTEEDAKAYWFGEAILFDLDILSRNNLPSSKYNMTLKRMLLRALNAKVKYECTQGLLGFKLDRSEEEARGYLHQSFDEFFSPIVKKEENEEKLKELNEEKNGLVGELEKINKYQLTSKSQKKEKTAPIETRLLELSRIRKQLEEKLRSPEILLEFIPGYRKDFEEFEEGLPPETTELPGQRRLDERNFRKKWVEEKLNKKLEKLRKD